MPQGEVTCNGPGIGVIKPALVADPVEPDDPDEPELLDPLERLLEREACSCWRLRSRSRAAASISAIRSEILAFSDSKTSIWSLYLSLSPSSSSARADFFFFSSSISETRFAACWRACSAFATA